MTSANTGHAVVLGDLTLLNAFSSASAPGLLSAIESTVPLFADALAG